MKFTLEIELSNGSAAGSEGIADYFDLGCKLASLGADLKEMYAADRQPHAKDGNVVCDANGDTVGAWSIIEPRYTITPNDRNCEPFEINEAQYKALQRKYTHNPDGAADFEGFRSRARNSGDCIMLPWCGMWLGIEPDGYTHS
jgi:hypothetical protein